MKYRFILPSIVILILSGLLFTGCSKKKTNYHPKEAEKLRSVEKNEVLYYTCGMHPSVKVTPEEYDKGQTKCPLCNMDIVPVTGEETLDEEREISLRLSSRARKLANVRTSKVTYLPLSRETKAVGIVEYDERRKAIVSARINGRIDKLFVNFTGAEVKKGSPLVWMYSPDLVATQEEYILALETADRVKTSHIKEVLDNAESLVESTKRRLLLWGITASQITRLKNRKQAETHMTIYAPISGTVIHKTILEGKYVKEGENLYTIADLSHIWVLADIYEEDISWVKKGTTVQIMAIAFPDKIFTGTISFIDPYLNEKTRSVKIRIDISNPDGKLKPGMYVDTVIQAQLGENKESHYTCPMHPEVASNEPGKCPECGMFLEKVEHALTLAVPKSAVLDVGTRKLVYVYKGNGAYVSREVKLGPEAEALVGNSKGKYFPILEGLAEGETVVTRANFLLDSQTQLTGGAAGAYGGALGVDN